MLIDNHLIQRINELSHKQKAEGLTKEEAEEQKKLREAYVNAFRENLRGQLENMDIKNPDGTVTSLKDRHDARMKNQ